MVDEVVDEAVDGEAHGLGFGEAALAHVEDLFGADFANAGFVLDAVALAFDDDGRVGVGARVGVDEKGVAFGVVFAALEVGGNVDEAAIRGATVAHGDGFCNDVAGGFVSGVDHFGASVLVLTVAGEGDGEDFATGFAAFEDDAGVFHGEAGADVAVDPFDFGFFHGDAAFGDEVEDVGAPVLDGDVLDFRAFECDEFDDGTVEGGGLEFWGGAAFHVGDFGPFVGDDEGALELTEVFSVDAEVGLEGLFDFDAGGHVDEGAAGEDGAVESGVFVIACGDDFAEPLTEDFGVFVEAFSRAYEDDALFGEFFLHVGVGGFGVELGFDAGKEFALFFGNTEALEGFLHIFGHFIPTAGSALIFGEVVADFTVVNIVEVGRSPVGGVGFGEEDGEGFFAEVADPVRVVFDVADVVNGFFGQAVAGVVGVVFGIVKVSDVLINIEFGFFEGLAHRCPFVVSLRLIKIRQLQVALLR